ncbi:MAG: hypothetical protein EOM40_17330 [Clostridia bacterium]|nr:hypothetical protein [Clostridia bacterium]NCC44940.1 hypothetical protein [Clostridia bacterium]
MGIKDNYWKKYISKEERFADLVNGYVGMTTITGENLESLDNEGFIKMNSGETKKQLVHDVIKKASISGLYSIWAIENQENINYKMIFRNIGYTLESYERQLEELGNHHKKNKDLRGDEYISGIKKDDIVYPVIVIVVYFGEKI